MATINEAYALISELREQLETLNRVHHMGDASLEKAMQPFTNQDLFNLLEEAAQAFHGCALDEVIRNRHMNGLTDQDVVRFGRTPKSTRRLIEAVLVAFINHLAASRGCDLGLHTRHIF